MSTRSKSQRHEDPKQLSSTQTTPTSSTSANGAAEKDSPSKLTRLSRIDEKNTLISLNNRLAAIIERNQQLELENTQLTIQVESAEETLKVTTKTINESIGKENAEIRKQLLDSENEKAKALHQGEKFKKALEEANSKLQQAKHEIVEHKKEATVLRDEVSTLKLELEKQRFENAQHEAKSKSQDDDLKKLGELSAKLKKQLDETKFLNTQLQNEIKSKTAELSNKIELHQSEVVALRSFNAQKIQEVGEKLGKDYESNLQKVIKSLRAECEKQIANNKAEQENLFKLKETDMIKANEKVSSVLRTKTNELLQAEKTLMTTKSRVTSLEKEKEFLTAQLKAAEENLKLEGDANKSLIKELESQLKQLQDEKTQVINDYQDLMETKVALDNEIATYRKLLEGEEERLNLSMEARRASRKRQWSSK